MRVSRLELRDFRSYARAEVALGAGLTVVHGPNGAGKTNLLEALYFACTGRSCRTSQDRELVRLGANVTRVEVEVFDGDASHRIAIGLEPGVSKRITLDGAEVERLEPGDQRPLVSVFLPDRLELVKGAPALRRAHVDQLIAALWPTRVGTRQAFRHVLLQRNALLARHRGAPRAPAALDAWDAELARHAVALMSDRAAAIALVAGPFAELATALGLRGSATVEYRPRSRAQDEEGFCVELSERRGSELERGLGSHGPQRDEIAFLRDGRELRTYGSRGEQRLGLLALLLAERSVLAERLDAAPLLLLDDVMSELDAERRALLATELARPGQSLITTTELAHVPMVGEGAVTRLRVGDGAVLQEARAA